MVLRNVLYVPNYEVNLLSVNRCVKFGHKFTFNKTNAKLMLKHGPRVDLTEDSGLFYLKISFQMSSACHILPLATQVKQQSKEILTCGIKGSDI